MSASTPTSHRPDLLKRAIRQGVMSIALSMPLAALMATPSAWAQTASDIRFDIPAGSVSAALEQFSITTGINIS